MTAKTPQIPSDSAEVAPAMGEPMNSAEDHPDAETRFEDLTAGLDSQCGQETHDVVGASLDNDEDTSLVTSLVLHLLSEHHERPALSYDATLAMFSHLQAHTAGADHVPGDHRFRPGRALATMNEQDQDQDTDQADPPDADGD